jgi:thiaminase/transcriptional activator TenA
MYSAEEFANLASWCRAVCDESAAGAGEQARAKMQDAFLASSRFELDFWEQAWRGGRRHEQ